MDNAYHLRPAAYMGLSLSLIYLIAIALAFRRVTPGRLERILRCRFRSLPAKWTFLLGVILIFIPLVGGMTGLNAEKGVLFAASVLFQGSVSFLSSIPVCFLAVLITLPISIVYVFKAYVLGTTQMSQACFFMPCAPQPISDWDQSGALFVGLVLLFGAGVVYPVILYSRKGSRRKERLDRTCRRWMSVSSLTGQGGLIQTLLQRKGG
jgi:hypothetical protein